MFVFYSKIIDNFRRGFKPRLDFVVYWKNSSFVGVKIIGDDRHNVRLPLTAELV
jgi:hypothetical protein